jgi:hypothetical protein
MPVIFLYYLCYGSLWLTPVIFACTAYAYSVNARRITDDPQKKDFHPAAIFLAPFTWPFLFFASLSLFILRAFLYGVFLILFTIALLTVRKPFIFVWLDKIATAIGNKLLEANTLLIKLFLRPWLDYPQPI